MSHPARGESTSHPARGPVRDRTGIDGKVSAFDRRRRSACASDHAAKAARRDRLGIDGKANGVRRRQPRLTTAQFIGGGAVRAESTKIGAESTKTGAMSAANIGGANP